MLLSISRYISDQQRELLLQFCIEDDTIRGTVQGLEEGKNANIS